MDFPNLLYKVPNELIVNILMEMPDLVTLHNFLTAYPQSQDLYQHCYKKILKTVIQRLESLQIQKLVCTVISIRNLSDLSDIEDPKRYIDSHLQYKDSSLVIDEITDSLLALQDIALITQDIEYFQKSFTYQRPYSTLSLSHKETHISHALWRLQLICEIVRAQSRSGSHSTSLDDVGDHFILSLTDWDLEGMECTYSRVREQYRLLTSDPPATLALCPKVPISCPPPIIQRLLINVSTAGSLQVLVI